MHISSTGPAAPAQILAPGSSKIVPPGLARRGLDLPPGIAKKLDAGGTAPAGIAKRFPAATVQPGASVEPSSSPETSPATSAEILTNKFPFTPLDFRTLAHLLLTTVGYQNLKSELSRTRPGSLLSRGSGSPSDETAAALSYCQRDHVDVLFRGTRPPGTG